ncbi:hypothetical protein SDC9_63461 [bioreactor metagenome]|uniref:Uncharacterized protein n=1 Tax=bioreactor metagenome TaxID=1076179 RepID=A0A644XM71_9ZZZZ
MQGGPPTDGTACHPLGAQHLGQLAFRKAVLHGDQESVLGKVGTKERGNLSVLQLLGQEEDQVVRALHLFRKQCVHSYSKVDLSYNVRSL